MPGTIGGGIGIGGIADFLTKREIGGIADFLTKRDLTTGSGAFE
jgi:hypothetical protein